VSRASYRSHGVENHWSSCPLGTPHTPDQLTVEGYTPVCGRSMGHSGSTWSAGRKPITSILLLQLLDNSPAFDIFLSSFGQLCLMTKQCPQTNGISEFFIIYFSMSCDYHSTIFPFSFICP
jgi:hypothetical protein